MRRWNHTEEVVRKPETAEFSGRGRCEFGGAITVCLDLVGWQTMVCSRYMRGNISTRGIGSLGISQGGSCCKFCVGNGQWMHLRRNGEFLGRHSLVVLVTAT